MKGTWALLLLSLVLPSPEALASPDQDIKTSLTYLFQASSLQFQAPQTLSYLGIGLPLIGLSLTQDKKVSRHFSPAENTRVHRPLEVLAIASTFPLLPLTFYYLGHQESRPRLVQFSLEYFATMYLALIESGLVSFIPIHERPDKTRLNSWETQFRGKSSFPSGHVIPLAALTFKAVEFYGPWAGFFPGTLTLLVSYERIQSQKHYLSDLLGGILFAGLASLGVREAAQNTNNPEKNYRLTFGWPGPQAAPGVIFHLSY